MQKKSISLATCIFWTASSVMAGDIDLAARYLDHKLTDHAKLIYIDVAVDPDASDSDRVEALFQLGTIAFIENNYEVAISEWGILLSEYPEEAKLYDIQGKLNTLNDVYGENADRIVQNAVAESYISNGDFYSSEKSERVTIDTSWIPVIQASVAWYDRVIQEFAESPEARRAYLKKFSTIVGWEGRGQYARSYGLYNPATAEAALGLLEQTLEAFERDFPDDPSLQRLRFTIAQGYWNRREWDDTRKWLNLIIEKDSGVDGFWKDLAEWRLEKVEY